MADRTGTRPGDTDREHVARLLQEHYAAGRLADDEFEQRLHAAYAARTVAELAAVTAGLPPVSAGGPGYRTSGARIAGRRLLHRLQLAAVASVAAAGAGCVAAAIWLPHGILIAVILAALILPVLVASALAGAALWLARRAWHSGAWLEAVPMAAGAPWLGRAVWAARALLAGRAVWRAGRRLRRPRRVHRAAAYYQDHPGGAWHSAQVSDARPVR